MNKACSQPKIGIRAGGKYATGALPEPSFGGFLKDRAQAAIAALTPSSRPKLPAAQPTLAASTLQPAVNSVTDTGATGNAVNAMQAHNKANEEALSYKDGTPYVKGPGTGTSDSIPVKVSRGEAILPAKTVQAVGVRNLAKLIKETNGKEPALGARRKGKYANGMVEEFDPFKESIKSVGTGIRQGLVEPAANIANGLVNGVTGANNMVNGAINATAEALGADGNVVGYVPRLNTNIGGEQAAAQPTMAAAPAVEPTLAAQPAAAQSVNAPAVNPAVAATSVPTAKVQYSNQAMPGSANSTDTAMGVDARNGGINMKYGDNTTVVGTHTPMAAPAAPASTPIARGIRMQNGDRLSGRGGAETVTATQLDAPMQGPGARDFSANNMAVINAGIRKRMAAGGSNTFEGRSAPMSPEQQSAEAARVAEGQRVADINTAAVAAINEREQADANKAPDLTAFPDTIAGNRARKIAMSNYAAKSAGNNAQAELGIRRKQADTQNMSAQTQAANAASEAGLRNIQGQDAAMSLASKQKVAALRDSLSKTTDAKARAAIQQQIIDASGAQVNEKYTPLMGKDEMGNPVFMGAFDTRTGQRVDNTAPAQTGISREQVDAAAKAKGITDPSKLKELYATYGV